MSAPNTIKIPDGRGKTKDITTGKELRGSPANKQQIEEANARVTETSFWQRVGAATEAYNKFHRIYATDHQLTSEEEAAAVYLEVLNIRTFYPKELGGPERYDALCKMVWEWFEKNKNA